MLLSQMHGATTRSLHLVAITRGGVAITCQSRDRTSFSKILCGKANTSRSRVTCSLVNWDALRNIL